MRLAVTFVLGVALSLAACKKADSDKDKKDPQPAAKAKEPAKTPAPGSEAKPNPLAEAKGSYTIDSAHTQVVFKIKHMNASYQYGLFTRVEGSFSIDPADPNKNSIDLKIPTASVFTAVKKRDDHLRSPDFFDAKQFPQITFKSKKVEVSADNHFTVTGDLTMHGVTKELTLTLQHVGSGTDPQAAGGKYRTGFNGEATLKRSDWGMKFMVGAGLDDEVKLLLSVEGTRG